MAVDVGAHARRLFEPIFSERSVELGAEDRRDLAALKTYRYLRIAMVLVVLALAASVLIERRDAGCFQASISAYYFTPARSVFVAGLVAIGVALVVIKGSTAFEDACLNVAGMLAPIVAFVPTTDVGSCWSVAPQASPLNADLTLAPWAVANVRNNVAALLIAGFVAHAVAATIATIENRDVLAVARVGELGTRVGLLATVVLLVVGTALFWWWDGFATGSHGIAAVVMFVFLAMAAVGNGVRGLRASPRSRYGPWYLGVGIGMAAAAIVLQVPRDWDHRVLVLEMVEIALFVVFWLIQSKERWGRTV
jgi:hypothetical protein